MGSECVLTAEQLEAMTSVDGKAKLPSISGMICKECCIVGVPMSRPVCDVDVVALGCYFDSASARTWSRPE